ncbi:hypothetical protein ACX3VT_01515 [Aerococcus sanguinicola]
MENLDLIENEKFIEEIMLFAAFSKLEQFEEIYYSSYPKNNDLSLDLIESFFNLELATSRSEAKQAIAECFIQLYYLALAHDTDLSSSYEYVEDVSVTAELREILHYKYFGGDLSLHIHRLYYYIWGLAESVYDLSFPQTVLCYIYNLEKEVHYEEIP